MKRMKQESIEERRARKKKEAVRGVLGFALFQVFFAVCFVLLRLIPDLPKWLMVCFLVLAALCLVLILPALCVLKARMKEIEGGELDAADQS